MLWTSSYLKRRLILSPTQTGTSSERDLIKSYEALYSVHGIKFPLVVLAQDTWESDWEKSPIFKSNLNRFGMKHNRRGISLGEKNGHAYYARPIDSIRDYAAWQKRMLKARPDVKTDEQYLQMLDDYNVRWCPDCRYAEDKTYTEKIRGRMAELRVMR